MPIDQFTHTFKFEINKDGSDFIKGECEFDTDEKASYKIESTSEPLNHPTLGYFMELMALIRKIYEENGGVKNIKVSLKK